MPNSGPITSVTIDSPHSETRNPTRLGVQEGNQEEGGHLFSWQGIRPKTPHRRPSRSMDYNNVRIMSESSAGEASLAAVNGSPYTVPMKYATIQTVRPPTGPRNGGKQREHQDGCEHDCLYCYAKTMAIRLKRRPGSWKRPSSVNTTSTAFHPAIRRIMFPTPRHHRPEHRRVSSGPDRCWRGNDFDSSKPRLSCAKPPVRGTRPVRAQIVFRFSIGRGTPSVLLGTRRRPSSPARLSPVRPTHGVSDSISGEPMLTGPRRPDCHRSPLRVDSIWLGKINRLRQISLQLSPECEAGRRGEPSWPFSRQCHPCPLHRYPRPEDQSGRTASKPSSASPPDPRHGP